MTGACHARGAGVTQIDRVVEAVEETLKGNTVQMLAKKALPRLDLPKVRPVSLCTKCTEPVSGERNGLLALIKSSTSQHRDAAVPSFTALSCVIWALA